MKRVRFGECVLDSDTRQLSVRGEAVHLSPKAFQFLELLLESRPKALSRNELHERLWPGTFVSEGTLTSLLAEVRSATGDSAQESRFVRTVHRFGYAFSGSAQELRESVSPGGSQKLIYRLIWRNREIDLDAGENVLGRDRGAVAWIDEESVSRRHARIMVDDYGEILEDLGSKNGMTLRGRKIREPLELRNGDVIKIGPASLVFRTFHRTGSTASTVGKRTRRWRRIQAKRGEGKLVLAAHSRLGSYEVLAPLGAGGMGEVYRALDSKLGRQVAIKVLPGESSSDRARLDRFEKEARAASSLNHPNIVTIHEVGQIDSTSFIVMELVDWKDVA